LLEKKTLILSAHPDDIELGMGGTLNKLDKKLVKIVIFSDTVNVNGTTIEDELANSMKYYDVAYTVRHDIINMNFVNQEKEIKQIMFDLKNEFIPDVVFSTSPRSTNPDHRIVGESVKSVFMEQSVMFFETVRADYAHMPQLYVELTPMDLAIKLKCIGYYDTQLKKRSYLDLDLVKSQARFRGSQVSKTNAEAFEVYRIIV